MQHPTRIKVGAHTYTVTSAKAAIDAASREEGADLYGRTDHTRLAIALDPANAESKQREILAHETLHCLTQQTGLNKDLGDNEELFVNRLAPALVDLLRRNPHLVTYLTE